MSSSLYWKPVPKDQPSPKELPYGLKKAIARRIWQHDGSLHGDEVTIGRCMLSYLEGLDDGGVDGAGELIAAIQDHDDVVIWIGS